MARIESEFEAMVQTIGETRSMTDVYGELSMENEEFRY